MPEGTAPLRAVVDPRRCEAKVACVAACPRQALQIEPLPEAIRAELSPLHRLRSWLHGGRWAVVEPDRCLGCADCTVVCPTGAITLQQRS